MRIVATIIDNRLSKVAKQLRGEAERMIDATLNAGKANIVAGMQASSSPSAPGDYPGIDTGAYVGSIATQREGLEGQVYTALDNPPYPIFLEYGTSRMLPRPAFSPASVEMRKVLDEELSKVEGRLG